MWIGTAILFQEKFIWFSDPQGVSSMNYAEAPVKPQIRSERRADRPRCSRPETTSWSCGIGKTCFSPTLHITVKWTLSKRYLDMGFLEIASQIEWWQDFQKHVHVCHPTSEFRYSFIILSFSFSCSFPSPFSWPRMTGRTSYKYLCCLDKTKGKQSVFNFYFVPWRRDVANRWWYATVHRAICFNNIFSPLSIISTSHTNHAFPALQFLLSWLILMCSILFVSIQHLAVRPGSRLNFQPCATRKNNKCSIFFVKRNEN
jgi:hypothetical protein